MATLKELLSEKGKKVNLQFSTKEKNYLLEEAGFTDEEAEIFNLRSRGYTILQISFIMSERHGKELPSGEYTIGKVEARIRSIKRKIYKLL